MIEIAKSDQEQGILQKDISRIQDISYKYLDHIIHALKVAGLIRKKDRKGGYILTKPADNITVYEINSAFEPNLCIIDCLEHNNCDRIETCSTKSFWQELNDTLSDFYKSKTLASFIKD